LRTRWRSIWTRRYRSIVYYLITRAAATGFAGDRRDRAKVVIDDVAISHNLKPTHNHDTSPNLSHYWNESPDGSNFSPLLLLSFWLYA